MEIREKRTLVSYDELKETLASFKRVSKTVFSNYVPSSHHKDWADGATTQVYIFDSAVFIVHDKGFMAEVIFISSEKECVIPCMEIIHDDIQTPIVLERVMRENKDEYLARPNCVLRRMSRRSKNETPKSEIVRVEQATLEDIPELSKVFSLHFNPLTERIPDKMELGHLISAGGISIIRQNDGIRGFVVYEKDSANIHLRYWWVSPESRDMGYGAALLHKYFTAGQECIRQFLWVFSDNNNAIAKYEHYGFSFDGIADEIYIVKK